ncbi:MAG: DUF393 domain-containing protein [Anaerolineae bacterium]
MVTAIYDGNCVICNTTRHVVRALDWFKRVEFLDLHRRDEVETRFPSLDYAASMGEIHVIDDHQRIFAGFYGTRRMLRELPLGWPLWAVLQLPGVGNWLGPKIYRFIARNRYTINRLLGVELEQMEQDCIDGVCKIPER